MLLDVALELIAEQGPQAFSLAEASRRAGVSVAAPYRHFGDRDALLAAVAERGYRALGDRMRLVVSAAGSAPERLARAAGAYVSFTSEEPAAFAVMFGAGLDKPSHPALAAASGAVYALLLEPAHALVKREDGSAAEELALAVAVVAHGYATALDDGYLGTREAAGERAARRAEAAVRALVRGRRLLFEG